MFHVELRQFPHATNAFNLTREQLDARVLRPWVADKPFDLNDRRWSPEKAKLTIYEGPELAVEELGMGRGWGNVTKAGQNVTERLLAEGQHGRVAPEALAALKDRVAERAAGHPVGYYELLGMAGELAGDADANQRVELAARAIWELLREERVSVTGPAGAP